MTGDRSTTWITANPGFLRVAASVSQMLQIEPELDWARSAGLTMSAIGTATEIRAQLMVNETDARAIVDARIRGEGWWEPETADHLVGLARTLAAELRMKWERWSIEPE